MEECGLVFQVHGEVTDRTSTCSIASASSSIASWRASSSVSRLRVVFEHVTTREAVQFVQGARAGVAATITPQHLLLNRNAIFQGGIRPHTTVCRC